MQKQSKNWPGVQYPLKYARLNKESGIFKRVLLPIENIGTVMHTFTRELMQTIILIYINRFRHSTCTRKEIASFNNFHPFFLYGLCVFNDFYHGYKDLFWSIDLFSFGPDKLLRMNVQGEPDIIIL